MRYIPHSENDIREMLQTIGVSSFEELIKYIPSDLKVKSGFEKPGLSEIEIQNKYNKLISNNVSVSNVKSYLGAGAYEHFIPSVVNHLGSLPQFVTSYTPYQPESNQGTLQALFEYQTLMCNLTGTDVSNSSHYDGATSLAETAMMAFRSKAGNIVYSKYLNPFYKNVLKTYFLGHEEYLIEVDTNNGAINLNNINASNLSAIIVQSPNFLGIVEDIKLISEFTKKNNALLIACVNPISLGILEAPGNLGADFVVGEGQPLGNSLNFGGPYFGFMCAKKEHMRKIAGRIVGQTKDTKGRTGYVLTLQAREQHIRREKATSNICSNEALCALRAAIFMSYMGSTGFKNLSLENFQKAHLLKNSIIKISGIELLFNQPFFNEFAIKINSNKKLDSILKKLEKNKIFGGVKLEEFYPELKNCLLIAVTETKSIEDLQHFEAVFREILK